MVVDVAFIETFLWATYGHLDLTVINMGVSAETVSNTTEPGHGRRPWVHDHVAPALEIAPSSGLGLHVATG